MDSELYKRFVPHILSDLAERRTDSGAYLPRGRRRWITINGQRRRVFVYGDHVCYQNERFHDSDSEFRLTMAVTSAEIIEAERLGGSRGSNTKACQYVAQALLASGCQRLKKRFLRSEQHPDPDIIDTSGVTSEPPFQPLADTIRRQVNRYRSRHPDWRRDFDFELARFRSQFRDPEWYLETETGYRQWLHEFEELRKFEWFEAMKIVAMARFYHDQRRFDQAVAVYRKAILIARKAFMDEGFRQVILRWLRSSVKACLQKSGAVRDPGYRGLRIATART